MSGGRRLAELHADKASRADAFRALAFRVCEDTTALAAAAAELRRSRIKVHPPTWVDLRAARDTLGEVLRDG